MVYVNYNRNVHIFKYIEGGVCEIWYCIWLFDGFFLWWFALFMCVWFSLKKCKYICNVCQLMPSVFYCVLKDVCCFSLCKLETIRVWLCVCGSFMVFRVVCYAFSELNELFTKKRSLTYLWKVDREICVCLLLPNKWCGVIGFSCCFGSTAMGFNVVVNLIIFG